MYVMIRKYAGKGSLMDKLVPQVRDGLVPLLRQAPGFRRYCAFASEDGHIVSVSVFDDRNSADAANASVREWVGANLRDSLLEPPEVLAGEVRRDLSGQAGSGADGLYVTIRQYDGVRSVEKLVTVADEHILPLIRQAPGLRAHYTLTSEGDQSQTIAVSLFDGREHAMRVNDQVIAMMRERAKEVAPNPPRVTSGKVATAA